MPIAVDGEVRYVLEFFSSKIALPDPELLEVLGAISSQLGHLVERKRAEEALRKSEMRKAAILRSALDCIITFDLDGRITEFNPAAERAFGWTAQEAMGRELAKLIIPESLRDSHRRGLALYNATAAGPMAGRRMELTAMRADGTEFPRRDVDQPDIRLTANRCSRATCGTSPSDSKPRRITSELAAVVANSNDAIVACTLEGKIVSWNVGAERVYGFAAEEVIGKQLDMLIPPDRLDEFPQTLTMVKRGDSVTNYETVRLRKEGKRISVSVTDSPIRSEGGRVTGLSSIARDITERKRLEEELLQSQKMDAVGRLAGGIAHDFNNILTAILGYSDLIIGQIDDRHWMYKHLSEIRKAADFAASLTHQLLAFSRRQPLFLRVFSINDSVKSMQKMLGRVIGEHIQIQTHLKAEIGRLKADPSQLEQVLLNLCVNARDAMPSGGTITIETADVTYFLDDFYSVNEMPAGEYVKLTICDCGTGMTDEVKKHIFEPFFTTKEKGQGTGLGLATCYGIVKQSGGYITVDSTAGVGTTFSIYLPRVDESGEKSNIRKEVGQLPGGHETVLYVEDEITVRSLTAHVLRRLGLHRARSRQWQAGARCPRQPQWQRSAPAVFHRCVARCRWQEEWSEWIRQTRNGRTKVLFTSGYIDEKHLKKTRPGNRHGLSPEALHARGPREEGARSAGQYRKLKRQEGCHSWRIIPSTCCSSRTARNTSRSSGSCLWVPLAAQFDLHTAGDMRRGIERLKDGGIQLILLDLSLPDSDGLETFIRVMEAAPDIPLIVLSGINDVALAIETVQLGAQDYLVKGHVDNHLLVRSMQYAIERKRGQLQLQKRCQRQPRNARARGGPRRWCKPMRNCSRRSRNNKRRAEEALLESNRQLSAALGQLQATQGEIIQRERMQALGRMANGIAHDFNNALAPILGFSELLVMKPEMLQEPQKVRNYLELIHTAAKDSAKVVELLLREFYRYRDEGEVFTPVVINDVVLQAISISQPRWKDQALAEGVNIDIRTEMGNVPTVARQ